MSAKNIVVYCSSRERLSQEYKDCAATLGEWIGRNGHRLVYGGVHAGLMSITAQAVHDTGGKVIGVIPKMFLYRRSDFNDELITTENLNDRKAAMIEMGDVYVVLPGGIGTLDEWIATLSHNLSVGCKKKLLIVNIGGVFDWQLKQIAATAESPFAHGDVMERMIEVRTVDDMIIELEKITAIKAE